MDKTARGYSIFINWFNGICAVAFGGLMMGADFFFPGNTDSLMPLWMFDRFPLHDIFFTSLFWPGLALFLVNGVPNLIAAACLVRHRRLMWARWSTAAGALLIVWTLVEMMFIPNAASVLYLCLGIGQVAAGAHLLYRRAWERR